VDVEALLLHIDTLKVERDLNARKLEICKFALEDNNRRAVQGEDMYHNAEIDLWRSNSSLKVLESKIAEMMRHKVVIEEQLGLMKAGAGVSLKPRPISQSDVPNDITDLELHPCSFCNRFFTACDIIVASCRHMYHPFCIASLCAKKNRCVTCGELFHPGWWRSFGFKDLDAELQDKATELDPSKGIEDMKLAFEEDIVVQVPNCEYILLTFYLPTYSCLRCCTLVLRVFNNGAYGAYGA